MGRTLTHRRRLALLLVAALAIGIAAGFALQRSSEPELAPGRGPAQDPLAYKGKGPREDLRLEARAAAGLSHVLYAKSPGGAIATAARTARFRALVEAAAANHGIDPDTLEAIVFLESAGRPEAQASSDLSSAVGLTQILAQTGSGLLHMHVDLAKSRKLTKKLRKALVKHKAGLATRLRAQRRRADERFDPKKSLEATGRYLTFAKPLLGSRDDLAVESYHMGVGNLQSVLAAYGAKPASTSYAKLYFGSTPLRHAAAYAKLATFGDDSATYLWRVLAAKEIMRLYRQDPSELTRLQDLQVRKSNAEEVLHPEGSTQIYATPGEIATARTNGTLRPLPANAEDLHLHVDKGMGSLAKRLHRSRSLYRALRPDALAVLIYIAAGVHEISGTGPLTVTSTVRDTSYQRLLIKRNIQATHAYSLHTTGFAFDILRHYRSRRQAQAFQFMLDRLTALNLIAWAPEPDAIHVTVSSDAKVLLPLLAKVK
jgi:soluble lytic murein transglycosylase-like protein